MVKTVEKIWAVEWKSNSYNYWIADSVFGKRKDAERRLEERKAIKPPESDRAARIVKIVRTVVKTYQPKSNGA